ncbi:ATP-binding protein [Flavobacterium subsaxonicum]|uniref:Cell division protein n=1 Tax=Flavobacterium subsaxonicum WB 4.1-42 = DSM 21790 TaxID=1121898 RepID=A0A0A2N2P6_9FLAO|nr:ATP-binding protein [Flavobacterium subsaxonicum]KGO94715.1 cell division protein [Flavobacterium subsaxonicum WB 4.1-42 = DSM 21790]
MDNNAIDNLREALKFSPNNIPLKLHLAESLLNLNRLAEAETEYKEVLALQDNPLARYGLAQTYFKQGQYATCSVILEDSLRSDPDNINFLILYSKTLLKENLHAQAVENYKKVLEMIPGYKDEELDAELRIGMIPQQQIVEEEPHHALFTKPKINFGDVGGMDKIKKEIELKIIHPLTHADLYKAYGKKTGGGILLYGPPGCGKTFIAKATAGQINANFISVGLNDILDMWIGNSEKNLHEMFETARRNKPCVLFFDEIDALGASRSDMKNSGSRHLINQFLQELDGIDSDNDGILVLGATNAPWHLDTAFRRPGRFDRIIFIPPPDDEAREAIFKLKLNGKPVGNINYNKLAKLTADYSGADIEAIIDIAIEDKLEASFKSGIPEPIEEKDLANAVKKHNASTKEWFVSAKNFALYANESGLYNDVLSYLKIKK